MTRTMRQKQIRLQRKLSKESGLDCPKPKKARFITKERAFKYALKASRDSVPVKVYLCRCKGFHLTTK